MKSQIEVRKFAVEKAAEVMGAGAMIKDVVGKAKEIEGYITEGIELPLTYNETQEMGEMFKKGITSVLGVGNVLEKES